MTSIDLTDKIALVTGGSQGIGRAIVEHLHRAGARVVINHPGFEQTQRDAFLLRDQLQKVRPDSATVIAADIAKPEEVVSMIESIQRDHGGLDLLVNNAAILRDRTMKKMTLQDWEQVIAVNLSGVYHVTKSSLEILRDQGAIVTFGSIAAREGFFGQANYAAAKAGVDAMMRVVAREAGKRGIRANTIAPGVVETAMAEQIPDSVRREMLKNIPLGRFATPAEIASVVLFLCSPLASYITGATVEVNGGWRS